MAMTEVGPNENCNKDCVECMPQYAVAHGGVEQVSDQAASQLILELARQAEADREYIHGKLALYGDAVRSRWIKKSQQKRGVTILDAQPTLYPHKWSYLRISFGYDKLPGVSEYVLMTVGVHDTERLAEIRLYAKKVRDALLLPYLDVKTLKEDPNRLLTLLHHRSTSKLDDWVMFDAVQVKPGADNGTLSQHYNKNYVIMYGSDYGKLVP